VPRIAAPRPPSHSSIPSLLAALQTEYDASALQLFTLKKNYDDVRMELAHALYANDAAARVVARLMAERDEARSALASISGSLGVAAPAAGGDAEMADAQPSGPKLPAAAAGIVETMAKT
jgi:pre-mRNA-processing factor 19